MIRIAAAALLFASTALAQQATFKGVVLTDSTERPIPGVTVTIELLKLSAISDSLGEFTIKGIAPGTQVISARKVGFGPVTTRVTFMTGAVVEVDLMMTPTTAQSLPDVTVKAAPAVHGMLAEFEQRRAEGHGRFVTRDMLEKRELSNMVEILRTHVPGLNIVQSAARPGEAFVAAGRMSVPGGTLAFNSGGPPRPCYAAVVLDGVMVFHGDPGSPKGAAEGMNSPPQSLFDINSIPTRDIAGIEYYAGAATMPIKYNSMRNTCGLIVVWTRVK
jgi:hypothetical protein